MALAWGLRRHPRWLRIIGHHRGCMVQTLRWNHMDLGGLRHPQSERVHGGTDFADQSRSSGGKIGLISFKVALCLRIPCAYIKLKRDPLKRYISIH